VPLAVALAVAVVLDLIAWAAFRIDKARARRQAWRIRERTLLVLAALGGVGALTAMYGHRRRHKVGKPRFVVVAVVATLAQLGGLAWLALGAGR